MDDSRKAFEWTISATVREVREFIFLVAIIVVCLLGLYFLPPEWALKYFREAEKVSAPTVQVFSDPAIIASQEEIRDELNGRRQAWDSLIQVMRANPEVILRIGPEPDKQITVYSKDQKVLLYFEEYGRISGR